MTAVSAPGKVLLTGGYLVLSRSHTGLVLSLDARIHILIQPSLDTTNTIITSPQFPHAKWTYTHPSSITPSNPFLESTLYYTLSYLSTVAQPIPPVKITILSDNAYFSSPNPARDPFQSYFTPLESTPKTGLGSSAALVTSLTAALLTHHLPPSTFTITSPSGKQLTHNLAQAAHSAAQGKIGSGFDVAAAVYGSGIYRRFSPNILSSLAGVRAGICPAAFPATLKSLAERPWDGAIHPLTLPHGLRIVMCDISTGSSTPGMVKQVLQWRENDPAADELWNNLQRWNDRLVAALRIGDEDLLRCCFGEVRGCVRDMGRRSGVPIEPPGQTTLLDKCSTVEGVLGGVVPGAGGYDAVVLVVRDDQEAVGRLKGVIQEVGGVRILDVREGFEGVRVEKWEIYEGVVQRFGGG
ncbi:Phosphomevalonate kinase [Piedraia hortae CBS 480.64]|uniref:phosphomevalonate kinase n=1 Tax=Piedraia hortae CBS 480.64 TaxID=1314780 RepID=A0A6A7BR22_9PEZI|nr:Phosphomevalonate kinase [Piedraia hortae CBS 480.64]